MTNLPDWLWPAEDEEAVLEAERLIEETHLTLQRMEADMQHKHHLGDASNAKTEKLKCMVNAKIHHLEKELKDISTSTAATLNPQLQQSHQSYQDHKVSRMRIKRQGTSVQEQIVSTALDKVQDALQVAQSVYASLSQTQPKPSSAPQKMANVGIFEVKSRQEEMSELSSKPRLGQSHLSSISIKRSLECQTIPPIHLPPGEKSAPLNVAIRHVRYQEEGRHSHTCKPEENQKESEGIQVKELPQTSDDVSNSHGTELAHLSRQLAEVEELRELNQTQVNHVLRFLISRVCALSNTDAGIAQVPFVLKNNETLQTKTVNNCESETLPSSLSTSASENSRPRIVYDSLSRFIETYRQAAQQAMVAKKKAAVRQKKIASEHLKNIESLKKSASNHLLIGPLRPKISKPCEEEPEKPLSDSPVGYFNTSSDGVHENELHSRLDGSVSSGKNYEDFNSELYKRNDLISIGSESSHSKVNSGELDIHPSKLSEENYEDDWEEDVIEDFGNAVKEDCPANPSLQPIIEGEEQSHASHPEKGEPQSPIPVAEQESLVKSFDDQQQAPRISESLAKSSPSDSKTQSSEVSTPLTVPQTTSEVFLALNEPTIIQNPKEKSSLKEVKSKRSHINRQRIRTRQLSSGSSSSADFDDGYHQRRSRKSWDLRLKDDLQLKSAVVLNWQLEDEKRRRSNEVSIPANLRPTPLQPYTQFSDVEERWKKALNELDQRIRAMEEQDKVARMLNSIKLQTKEEHTQTSPFKKDHEYLRRDALRERSEPLRDELENLKVPSRTPVVLTDRVESNELRDNLQPEYTTTTTERSEILPEGYPVRNNVLNPWQYIHPIKQDMTEELLAYGHMGMLAKNTFSEHAHSTSLSSSTASSLRLNNHFLASLSDGEMRASGSCSCSEGEVCLCRSGKGSHERGSGDTQNCFRDVSQGELALAAQGVSPFLIQGDISHAAELSMLSNDTQ